MRQDRTEERTGAVNVVAASNVSLMLATIPLPLHFTTPLYSRQIVTLLSRRFRPVDLDDGLVLFKISIHMRYFTIC